MFIAIVLAAALVLGPPPANSASPYKPEALFQLDPATTTVHFTLKGFPHTTTGSFRLKRGEMVLDPATGAADGAVVVDAASGTTGIGMRDSEMKNSILDVQHYPEVVFIPRHVQFSPVQAPDFTVIVDGLLYLRGNPHKESLAMAVHRSGDVFTASTHLIVPYVSWGLKNPSLLFLTVADEVTIDVNTQGRLSWKSVL